MKLKLTFAMLVSMLPVALVAQPHTTSVHLREQTFHDRAPRIHDRAAKPHYTSVSTSRS